MRKKRKTKKILIAFLASLIIFLGFSFSVRFGLAADQTGGGFFSPFMACLTKISDGMAGLFASLFNSTDIKAENEKLIFQNNALKAVLNEYAEMKKENDALKEALNLKEQQNFNFILANVISRSPLNFSQIFEIDQGLESGIEIGQMVVWAGQALVGEVMEVDENSASVRSINDSEFRAAVFIGENRVEAVWKGNGLSSSELDLVPAQTEVKVGDRIITSGLDQKFPRGFYLGEVKEVKKVDGKVFQEVIVTPSFNWDELEEVLIVQ